MDSDLSYQHLLYHQYVGPLTSHAHNSALTQKMELKLLSFLLYLSV